MQTGDGQEGSYSEGTFLFRHFPFCGLLVSDCTLALHKGMLVEEAVRAGPALFLTAAYEPARTRMRLESWGMAQWIKHLPYKCEYLSPDRHQQYTQPDSTCSPELERQRPWILGAI